MANQIKTMIDWLTQTTEIPNWVTLIGCISLVTFIVITMLFANLIINLFGGFIKQ